MPIAAELIAGIKWWLISWGLRARCHLDEELPAQAVLAEEGLRWLHW